MADTSSAVETSNPYTLNRTDGVLDALAKILLDIHLRLIRSEARDSIIDEGASALAQRGTSYIESVMLPLAAEMDAIFQTYYAGVPAESVQVSAERQFITEATASEIDDHIADRDNPHEVTKAQVGLSNVDNTSDATKPVSTAQATAIAALNPTAGNSPTWVPTKYIPTGNPVGDAFAKVGKTLSGFVNVLDFGDGWTQMAKGSVASRDFTACFNAALASGSRIWVPKGDYPFRTYGINTADVKAAVYYKSFKSVHIEGEPGTRLIAGKELGQLSSGLFWLQSGDAPETVLKSTSIPAQGLVTGGRHTNSAVVKGLLFDGTELSNEYGQSNGTGITLLKLYGYINPEVGNCKFIGGYADPNGFNPLGSGNIDQGLSTHGCLHPWVHHCYFEGIYDTAVYPNGTYVDVTTKSPLRCTLQSPVVVVYHRAHGFGANVTSITISQANSSFDCIPVRAAPYPITVLDDDTYSFTCDLVAGKTGARATGSFGGTVVLTNNLGAQYTLKAPFETAPGSFNVTFYDPQQKHNLAAGDYVYFETAVNVAGLSFTEQAYRVNTILSPYSFTFTARPTSPSNITGATGTVSVTGGDTVYWYNVSASEALGLSDSGYGFLMEHCRFYRCGAPAQFKRGLQRYEVRFCFADTCKSGFRSGYAGGATYGGQGYVHGNYARNLLGTGILLHGPNGAAERNVIENFGKLPNGKNFTNWQGIPNWTSGEAYFKYTNDLTVESRFSHLAKTYASVVNVSGVIYYCTQDHVATTFNDDRDAGKWVQKPTTAWAGNQPYNTVGQLLASGNYLLEVLQAHTSSSTSNLLADVKAGYITYKSATVYNEDTPLGGIVLFSAPRASAKYNTVEQKGDWLYSSAVPASISPAAPLKAFVVTGSLQYAYGSTQCEVVRNTIKGVPIPFYEMDANEVPKSVLPDYNLYLDNWIAGARLVGGLADIKLVGPRSTIGKVTVYNERATAQPTAGEWEKGDYVRNAAPAIGAPKGWYCTASGSPGTWRPDSNLA